MKIIFIVLIAFFACLFNRGYSQNLNWGNLQPEQRHIVSLNTGWDYGLTFGAGYAYQLKTKMPAILNISHSFPSGKNVLDDFKTKIGAQVRLLQLNHISLSTNLSGVFRRYQNPLINLSNFGSDVALVVGYYKPQYFIAGETGFDKAIATHFKHSSTYIDVYPGVRDGWYEPSTGGNFYYGLKTAFSMKRSDLSLRLGKVITQDFKTSPLIPFYAELGYSLKFASKKKNDL